MERGRDAHSLPCFLPSCVEPLAAQVHQDLNISKVLVRGGEFKITLFADDTLLTLTRLRVTLPNLHKLLEEFGPYLAIR